MDSIYFHSDDTITFPIVEGVSIHELNDDIFYSLESEVAIDIWELLNGSNSVSDIIRILCREYLISESIVKNDVLSFINQLLENNLIQRK